MAVTIKYQTAIATFTQFIVLTLLNLATGTVSVVTTCTNKTQSGDCGSNLLASMALFILTALWFGSVWMLGYVAQDKRSKRLSQLLILVEIGISLFALLDIRHHTDALGLITSLLDLGLAIWTIILATRILRAKGGRIVVQERSPRARRRPAARHLDQK